MGVAVAETAAIDLVPSSPEDGGSALSDFLSRSTVYEKAGSVIPRDLLQFGFLGSMVVIGTGVLALVFPSPESVHHGGFFLLLGSQAADLVSFLHAVAIPAIVCGVALLGLDVYLMRVPTSEHWRAAVVVQAVAGGAGGTLCTLFLVLLVLNLVIWMAIIACAVMVVFVVLAVLADG
jgi:hypothetical protein